MHSVYFIFWSILRVCYYIKYGWDVFLIDWNKRPKKITCYKQRTFGCKLIQLVPKANDVHWTKDLHKSPKVTFNTIHEFLVECKVLLKKVVHIECVLEKRDSSMLCGNGSLKKVMMMLVNQKVTLVLLIRRIMWNTTVVSSPCFLLGSNILPCMSFAIDILAIRIQVSCAYIVQYLINSSTIYIRSYTTQIKLHL